MLNSFCDIVLSGVPKKTKGSKGKKNKIKRMEVKD